jgi:hypothetical protein
MTEDGPRLTPRPFADLTWRNIGPTTMGGRIDRVAVSRTRGQPDQIYIAATRVARSEARMGNVVESDLRRGERRQVHGRHRRREIQSEHPVDRDR